MRKNQTLSMKALLVAFLCSSEAFSVVPRAANMRSATSKLMMSSASENESVEVLRSLVDFHDGTWKGRATSFAITPDVAAGIVQRKVSPEYKTSIKVGLSPEREFSMTETLEWQDKISSRSIPLVQSNMDVDSVDASYSLDSSLPDMPSDITGTDKLLQFGIEHCIAVNDDARVRCLAFYGVDESLARVVVMHEQRVKSDEEKDPMLALSSDVDRIVDKITGQVTNSSDSTAMKTSSDMSALPRDRLEQLEKLMSSSSQEDENALSLHPMSLLELSSGVWLGDSIVRDLPNVPSSPFIGGFSSTKSTQLPSKSSFASWDMGVQKSAWRWIWKFGETIRQQDDVGNAMGSSMAKELSQSLSGSVCVNEGLSRRIPKDERMVFINWNNGDHVSFLLGSVSVQLPRFINFDKSSAKKVKPFYTEFCVYQSAAAKDDMDELPELCCSKIARVYNYAGQLKQGCTSFYTMKRFGADE